MTNLDVKRDSAWIAYDNLQKYIKKQAELYIVIGKTLKDIRDQKLFTYLGEGGYDTFQQFLNNHEIGLRPSTAYLYIRIYEYYIERLQLLPAQIIEIPINRLMRLLPSLKQKEDEESKQIVENISTLTNYDFDVEVKEKSLETKRPILYKDKETGKYVFEFYPEQMERIVDMNTGETIWEAKKSI